MDLVLITGSLALSLYLPRQVTRHVSSPADYPPPPTFPKNNQQSDANGGGSGNATATALAPVTISVSTAISFLLLSLSILEAFPSSWMIVLDGSLLPTVYKILFAILVFSVFIVFPFAAGSKQQQFLLHAWQESAFSDVEVAKKQRMMTWNSRGLSSYLLLFLLCLVRSLLRAVYYCFALLPVFLLKKKDKGPILATTSSHRQENKHNPTYFNGVTSYGLRYYSILGGVLCCLAVFCILSVLGPWVIRTTDKTPFLTIAVSWLTAVGLLLSACINGFGSVSMPYSCLAGFYLEPIRLEAISNAHEEIQQASSSLKHRKKLLESSGGLTLQTGASVISSKSSTTHRSKRFSDIGEESKLRRRNLQTEIEFLETLVEEMKDEAADMQQMQEMAAGARTFAGRCKLWLGAVFSLILVVRLFSAAVFLWNHDYGSLPGDHERQRSGSDPITMILLWLVGHDYVTQQDYNTLSQFISCAMTAVLSFSQVRTFFRTMNSVNRRLRHFYQKVPCLTFCSSSPSSSSASSTCTSSSAGITDSSWGVYENFLACLMVCYFLSCIVLTKLMLPLDYRAAFAEALGDDTESILRIRSYSLNFTFTLSALTTAFLLGVILGIQRQNTVRHLSGWKATANTSSDQSAEP
ncbi:hypothetical protein ACA910_016987 [Epithemia clementina (nom. ined.)]